MTVSDSVPPADWERFVTGHPAATHYHQYGWRGVFEQAFGHQCHYLAALDSHRVVGILPLVEFRSALFGRFAVSLPFVNYGGLLVDDARGATALVAQAVVRAKASGWRHVELRHLERQCPDWPAKRHKVVMLRPLEQTADALWASLDRKVRNQVRKAEKCGIAVEEGGSELVPQFYRVFAHNMRDLGTPVYARRLFECVLGGPGARIFVARAGSVPVAAAVTLRWRDRVEVPWASSLRQHHDKSPNTLLYYAMLQSAVSAGARVFDFGRSTRNEGTFQFKQQWGAEPRDLTWEYVGLTGAVPDQSPKNPTYRAAIAAWQRLPVPVATAIGPRIVRNIP